MCHINIEALACDFGYTNYVIFLTCVEFASNFASWNFCYTFWRSIERLIALLNPCHSSSVERSHSAPCQRRWWRLLWWSRLFFRLLWPPLGAYACPEVAIAFAVGVAIVDAAGPAFRVRNAVHGAYRQRAGYCWYCLCTYIITRVNFVKCGIKKSFIIWKLLTN